LYPFPNRFDYNLYVVELEEKIKRIQGWSANGLFLQSLTPLTLPSKRISFQLNQKSNGVHDLELGEGWIVAIERYESKLIG
jgi:hypothetical protein